MLAWVEVCSPAEAELLAPVPVPVLDDEVVVELATEEDEVEPVLKLTSLENALSAAEVL